MTGPDSAPRDAPGHREMRERIGDYALGLLPPQEAVPLQAHLDGCPDCRADLADIQPLARDLKLIDPELIPGPPAPPAELGARISHAVRLEKRLRDQRERGQSRRNRIKALVVPGCAATAAAAATVLLMSWLGPAPQQPQQPEIQAEQLAVRTVSDKITGTDAKLVAHTWGLEVKLVASGLDAGTAYRGVVLARDGRELPAGAFLGTGDKQLTCNLQAAVLRDQAVRFSLVDASTGRVVLTASLPVEPPGTAAPRSA